jgi:ABC-2 type transport system permease protein
MNRFLWLIRREVAEHRAIWIAPAIVIGCLFFLLMVARAHLGFDVNASFADIPRDGQIRLHLLAYAMVTGIIFLVMGTVGFFYCIDSLYADRADRSVLFWKSLPLSDAETVLSKFATGAVLVPLVAAAGAVIAQVAIGGGLMAKLALSGQGAGLWLHPQAIAGGALMALMTCAVAVLWYAPVVSYLMLASAWAPRAPFLWAVLPPVAAAVLEAVVLQTSHVRDLVFERLFGLYAAIGERRPDGDVDRGDVNGLKELAERLGQVDWQGRVSDFMASPDLWFGVLVAALLLAAAMWVRRYRDETS